MKSKVRNQTGRIPDSRRSTKDYIQTYSMLQRENLEFGIDIFSVGIQNGPVIPVDCMGSPEDKGRRLVVNINND